MVSRILQAGTSTGFAFEYSEKKVAEGNATVAFVRNMPDDSWGSIKWTLERYESNPGISARMRKTGFHMAVCPDVSDPQYGADAVNAEYIDDIMRGLGYGNQPYAVYRHDDIDRTHYHVVSVRVDEKGRAISSSHEALRLLELMRDLRPKYGYNIGRNERRIALDMDLVRVLPTDMDKVDRIGRCFDEALKYDYTSFQQFRAVLAQMGVHVRRRDRDGSPSLWLSVEDGEGRLAMAGFDAGVLLRDRAVERYLGRERVNADGRRKDVRARAKITAAMLYCADRAGSWAEFRRAMADCGLTFTAQEKEGRIQTYTVVDPTMHSVMVPSELVRAVRTEALNARGWDAGETGLQPILGRDDLEQIRRNALQMLRDAGIGVVDRRGTRIGQEGPSLQGGRR